MVWSGDGRILLKQHQVSAYSGFEVSWESHIKNVQTTKTSKIVDIRVHCSRLELSIITLVSQELLTLCPKSLKSSFLVTGITVGILVPVTGLSP